MKNLTKKLLALLACGAMIFALAACNNDEGSTNPTPTQGSET